MRVEKFIKENHCWHLQQLIELRDVPLVTLSSLPEIGFVVYSESTPVAAAFLRKVEGGFGQVDGLISNPNCSSEQRHLALDLAIDSCIEAAANCGIFNIISFCLDNQTTRRAERHGFVKQPHSIVTLNVKAKV